MKLANVSSKKIEEITAATIQAYEKITELHTDLKEKTRRIDLLEVDLAAAQNDTLIFQQRYQDAEKEKQDIEAENKVLYDSLLNLKSLYAKKTSSDEITAAPIETKENENVPSKIEQLQSILRQKEEKIKSQQALLDLKHVECNRFKKMSKKYAKAINTVSPQAVNNVRFVRKFPLLELRCNSLEEKLNQVERERDMLLSRIDEAGKESRQVLAEVENGVNAQLMPTPSFSPSANQQTSSLQYTSSSSAPINNNNNMIPLSQNTSYSNYRPYSSKSYFTPALHQEFGIGRAPLKRRSSQELLYGLERSKNKVQS